jgi:hypothetical protein
MSRHGFAPGLAPARQRITGKQPPRAERPEFLALVVDFANEIWYIEQEW